MILLQQIHLNRSLKEKGEIKIRKENLNIEHQSFDLFLCNSFVEEIKMHIFSYFSLLDVVYRKQTSDAEGTSTGNGE